MRRQREEPECAEASREAPATQLPRTLDRHFCDFTLSYGTDCSGMCVLSFAIRCLPCKARRDFASDADPLRRSFLQRNRRPAELFADVALSLIHI
eukprot:12017334-Alexandrium_andersonii.AAC.1